VKVLSDVDIQISNYVHVFPTGGQRVQRPIGDVSCTVTNSNPTVRAKLRLRIQSYENNQPLKVDFDARYKGEAPWSLNPGKRICGHFQLPINLKSNPFNYRVEIFWSIIDDKGEEHRMLPFSYVWNDPQEDWWHDPGVLHENSDSLL